MHLENLGFTAGLQLKALLPFASPVAPERTLSHPGDAWCSVFFFLEDLRNLQKFAVPLLNCFTTPLSHQSLLCSPIQNPCVVH